MNGNGEAFGGNGGTPGGSEGHRVIVRPKMARENRAKQFAPFATLSGLAAALLAKELEMCEAAETVRTEEEDAPP